MGKIKGTKGISIVLLFIMVFQMIMPVNFAYGAAGSITDNVKEHGKLAGSVTLINPDTGEVINPSGNTYNNVPENAVLKIKYNFELPFGDGYEFTSGDYMEINLPDGIEFKTPLENQILDSEGIPVATYEITSGKIKITFTEYVEEHSQVFGNFSIEGTFEEDETGPGQSKTINIEYKGSITIVFEKDETPPAGAKIEKSGAYDHETGYITWALIVTPDGELEDVTIYDEFSANQVYVDGSFSAVTSGTGIVETVTGSALTVIGNEIIYELGAISEVKTFQFKTEPTDTAFSGKTGDNENKDAVRFTNDAEVKVNGTKTDEDTSGVSIDWIEKFGVFDKGTQEIEWTININNNKYKITNAVITDTIPNGLSFVSGSAKFKVSGGSFATINPDPITGNILSYEIAGSLQDTATLKYRTKVDNYNEFLKSNDGKSFKNEASLSWSNNKFGMPSDSDTVGVVGQGGILNKYAQNKSNYDDKNNKVVWTVQINRNKAALGGTVSFTDKIPNGLKYVNNSIKVASPSGAVFADTIENVSYEEINNILSFAFKSDVLNGNTYAIQYETEVVDKTKLFVNGDVSFANNATVTGTAIIGKAAGTGTQTFNSQVIEKSRKTNYSYSTREVEWEIVINRNNLTLPNAVLTDEIPEGMEYAEGFSVTPAIATTTGAISSLNPKIEGNTLTYEMGTITEQHTIRFKTRVTDEGLEKQGTLTADKNLRFTNTATISATGFGSKSDTAYVDVKNPIVEKTGESVGDYVKWTVKINSNSIELDELELSDSLNTAFTLDIDSVKLYTATGTAISLTKGSEVSKGKYQVSYDKDNNIFTFRFEDENGLYKIDKPYILEFITSVSKDGINISNTITLKGKGSIGVDAGTNTSVYVNKQDAFGGGANGKITITKVDEDEPTKKLSGAKFKIYTINKNGSYGLNAEATTSPDGKVTFTRSGSTGSTAVDNDAANNGTITFDNLLYKTHYVEETDAPEGYLRDATVKIFTIFDSAERIFTFANKKIYGDIEFIKLDASNSHKPLRGAEFELFAKDTNGEFTISKGTDVSDESGTVKFIHIEAGDYQIREIEAPKGYKLSTDVIDATVGRDASQTEVVVTLTVDGRAIGDGLANELVPVYGNIEFDKVGRTYYEDDTYKDIPLEGAKFTLYNEEDEQVLDQDENEIHSLSNADGKVIFENIPLGRYKVIETEAPKGYIRSNVIIYANIERNDEELDKADVTYRFDNEDFSSGKKTIVNESINIEFNKSNVNGEMLDGAKFELKKGEEIIQSIDSKDGKIIFTAVPAGDYTIEEKTAPSGYKLLEKPIEVEIVINDNGTEAVITLKYDGQDYGNRELTVVNERKPGGGGSATPVLGKIAIKKVDENKKVLLGAEFTLYDESGKVVDKAVTGSDGTVSFTDLKPGEYVLKETKAPEGYVLDDNETDVAISGSETKTFTFTNKKEEPSKPGRIEIIKTDDEGKLLSGAEFTLFNENNQIIGTAVSDKSGRVMFEDLVNGKYFVRETKAPEGYELVSDTLSINVTEGKTYSYKFKNVPSLLIEDPDVPIGWETIEDPDVPGDITLPDTGSVLNTWILTVIGLMFILAGILLYGRRSIRS